MSKPDADAPKPLYFTFGNHMHWVDMQWLWGYQVLPDCVRDMLHLCRETGARGNVNFDGIGYEKLAAEDPGAMDELRAAVRGGLVEIVGASYGQPYGLFHGGESNVRQRIYGARVVRRHFGVWPTSFWEEEFDFFPQLPQILAGCGFRAASLFFQWTWHTPHVPLEEVPLVRWKGVDGTVLPALARTELCLHQWPEDFDGRLDSPLVAESPRPVVQQWLELMPSPDWMCRSEVLLPRLKELFADERFELRPRTLGELAAELDGPDVPERAYGMDDVWHGMSLGKNGDYMVRLSAEVEEDILTAEVAVTIAGLLGRPYPSWDVYPTWELDEAWRELLAAQHHDNHECEGLCGSIGERSFERAGGLAEDVLDRTLELLASRAGASGGKMLLFNPLGWDRRAVAGGQEVGTVPAFGYRVFDPSELAARPRPIEVIEADGTLELRLGDQFVSVSRTSGGVLAVGAGGRRIDLPAGRTATASVGIEGERVALVPDRVAVEQDQDTGEPFLLVSGEVRGVRFEHLVLLGSDHDGIDLLLRFESMGRFDPGYGGALVLDVDAPTGDGRVLADTPYAVGEVEASASHQRKYPSGDWMTSPQWFETVPRPFTATSLVDLIDIEGAGLLVLHDGSQAWQRTGRRGGCGPEPLRPLGRGSLPRNGRGAVPPRGFMVPWNTATACAERRNSGGRCSVPKCRSRRGRSAPVEFAPFDIEGSGVLATALYREHQKAGEGLANWFGEGVRNPFVLRLVEADGNAARARLRLPGPIERIAKTSLLGVIEQELEVEPDLSGTDDSRVIATVDLRPHEIATIMFDSVPGRHVPRNLDDPPPSGLGDCAPDGRRRLNRVRIERTSGLPPERGRGRPPGSDGRPRRDPISLGCRMIRGSGRRR